MIYKGALEGKFVNLRPVLVEDAEFILRIRNNPEISKFLPTLNLSAEQQRRWIIKQQSDNNSYYFIIQDKEFSLPIGTISVYNIEGNHAEVGRLCSIGDFIQNSEAILLHSLFIFEHLNLEYIDIWSYKDNIHIVSLHSSLGIVWREEIIDENGRTILCGRYTKDNYIQSIDKFRNSILNFFKTT